jgi:hypothetical protein
LHSNQLIVHENPYQIPDYQKESITCTWESVSNARLTKEWTNCTWESVSNARLAQRIN